MAIRKTRTSYKTIVLLAVVVFVGLVVARWAWSNHKSSSQAQVLLDQIQQRQDNIESRLVMAQARNELLETDTGMQDFLIEKYAVKREGERVLVLVRDENERAAVVEPKQVGFWSRMGKLFFE